MTTKNKAAQDSEINTNFADNTTGAITPALLRTTFLDAVDSYQQAPQVNAQTGTTYTFLVGDYGNLVTFANAASIAVTLPQAVSTFAVWNVFAKNVGVGAVTITPTTSTINGNATLVLGTGQSAFIVSDGANYQALLSSNVVSVSSPLSLTSGVLAVSGAAGEIPNGTTGAFTATPTLGVAGSVLGTLSMAGNTSGTITIQPQAAAGTYNFNLPTSAGSSGQPLLSGGGGASAMTFGTLALGAGGTGQTTAPLARASSGLNIDAFTGHGDSIYTILSTDRVVGTTAAFTASRTWTLPAANSVNAGQSLIVADFAGGVTGVNTLVISRAGADTINGGTTVTISAANGAFELISDGTSKWTGQAIGSATTAGVSSIGGLNGAVTLGNGFSTSGTSVILALRDFISGLTLSNDGVTPNSVLDVAAGQATDSTNAVLISIGAFTKSTAGAWAAGSGSNGMGNGLTIAASTWYHVILANNGGTADIYFDTSPSGANRPAGISDAKIRRIGSFKTDGSSHIIAFYQNGFEFLWNTPVADLSNTAVTVATATLITLTVPTGIIVEAMVMGEYVNTSAPVVGYFSSPNVADVAPSAAVSSIIGSATSATNAQYAARIFTNTSAQIRTRFSVGSGSIYMTTIGWIDTLGRFA